MFYTPGLNLGYESSECKMQLGEFAWGIILGAAIGSAGSALAVFMGHKLEEISLKKERKRFLIQMLRQMEELETMLKDHSFYIPEEILSLHSFDKAMENGAIGELPDNVSSHITKARYNLARLRGQKELSVSPLLLELIQQSLDAAIKSLKEYLKD